MPNSAHALARHFEVARDVRDLDDISSYCTVMVMVHSLTIFNIFILYMSYAKKDLEIWLVQITWIA